jgi:hypothetical protein
MRRRDSKSFEPPGRRENEQEKYRRETKEMSGETMSPGREPGTLRRTGRKLIWPLDEREKVWYKPFMEERRCLYLKVGDWVVHRKYPEWGSGRVVEEQNSSVVGGLSLIKVTFLDGQTRVFDNNFKNVTCCYHAGLRRR